MRLEASNRHPVIGYGLSYPHDCLEGKSETIQLRVATHAARVSPLEFRLTASSSEVGPLPLFGKSIFRIAQRRVVERLGSGTTSPWSGVGLASIRTQFHASDNHTLGKSSGITEKL